MKAFGIKNKVAVITGSSQGIGKATALCLANHGACVMLNGRDEKKLFKVKSEFESLGFKVNTYCGDLTQIDNIKSLIQKTIQCFGRIDILINNAGVSMRGNFSNLNQDIFKRVFEINVFATVNISKLAMPYLRQSRGSLVFISSVAGIRGLPGNSAYCSSKMALKAIAESIRIEEEKSNIHVGLINVGITEIDKNKTSISEDGSLIILKERSSKKVHTKAQVAEAILNNIRKRKFVTTLTILGKVNLFMQKLVPGLVERILILSNKKVKSKLL